MHPQGLIFDFDGTLADTMPLHWHAWEIIAARHGFNLTRERLYSLGGVPSRDIIKMLATPHPDGEAFMPNVNYPYENTFSYKTYTLNYYHTELHP